MPLGGEQTGRRISAEVKVAACTWKKVFWFHNLEQAGAQNKSALLKYEVIKSIFQLLPPTWQPQHLQLDFFTCKNRVKCNGDC